MKTERLLGIIATLQQRKKVTAAALAEKFEVSVRTIRRDIDALCMAGIPIVTIPGKQGGISLMDGYALDTTVFTEQEMDAIITGLGSLDSVSASPRTTILAEKLGADPKKLCFGEVEIDLASFYKDDLAAKIARLRHAIRTCHRVRFTYYYPKGRAEKEVEPTQILYRWSDWYLYGYHPDSAGFRLYKLRRMWDLTEEDAVFMTRSMPEEKQLGRNMTDDYLITAIYDSAHLYRPIEEYGPTSVTMLPDGRGRHTRGFSSIEKALAWFLSLGSGVEIIDPPEFAARLAEEAKKIFEQYENADRMVSPFVCYDRENTETEASNMNQANEIETRCGLSCRDCSYRIPNQCRGCITTDGKPYHGSCPVAQCCQARKLLHCGECPDFPCAQLGAYSFAEGEDGGARIRTCLRWLREAETGK